MAPPKPIYSTCVTVVGFICLILGCIALILPIWGHFEDRNGGYQAERGYFGPFKICKKLNYGRETCGERFRFQVTGGAYVSGILSMISCMCFALFSVLSILQLAMISSRDEVVLKYKTCVISKLVLSITAVQLTVCLLRLCEFSSENEVSARIIDTSQMELI